MEIGCNYTDGSVLLQLHLHYILFHYADWIMVRLWLSLIFIRLLPITGVLLFDFYTVGHAVPPTHIVATSQFNEICFDQYFELFQSAVLRKAFNMSLTLSLYCNSNCEMGD